MNIKDAQACPFGHVNGKLKMKSTRKGDQYCYRTWYRVMCKHELCGLCGPWAPLVDSAIIEWNRITLK